MDRTQKVNQEYYDTNAGRWAEQKTHAFYSENEFRVFEKYLDKGDRVLDIGCGYGRDVPLFLGIGHKLGYEGLDISSEFLAIAQRRYPKLNFHKGNLLERETLPSGFNGFWAAATLQHVPKEDWDTLLDNIEGMMEPHAIGYFSLPEDRPNPASEKDPRHFSLFTEDEVSMILKQREWKLLETGVLPGTRGTTVWRWFIVRLP